MKLSYVISALEAYAPRALQENWDNTGLQIGLPAGADCTGALLCVDVTPEIIREAVRRGRNLVISHHPLIFKGLKSLTGRTLTEQTAYEAVRAGVAVYSSHTALDSTRGGVSYAMARRLGATPVRVLSPVEIKRSGISVICPRDAADSVRLVLFDHNAGEAPQASNASLSGAATAATPAAYTGTQADVEGWTFESDNEPIPAFELIHTPLTRVSAQIYGSAAAVLQALGGLDVADRISVDVTEDSVTDPAIGLGLVARFDSPVTMKELVGKLHEEFGTGAIRANLAAGDETRTVSIVALCGGSGGEFIGAARSAGADAYVTADVRYHDLADNREGMAIFDIGHFESETCSKDVIYDILSKKFSNFAVDYAECDANPVKYL